MTRPHAPLVLLGLLLACGGDEEPTTPTDPTGGAGGTGGDGGVGGCAPGQFDLDGDCIDAGLPADGCPPGHALAEDDSCLPAGVPPDRCGVGFEPDGDHGCRAILPPSPCESGQMALPGETSCREIAPCEDGTWGDIPVATDTQYVDGSYQGGSSDGTATHPWTTVQAGVDAAVAGAFVAIAAGSYPGQVDIGGKPVQLWGRCPALVELLATGGKALDVGPGADGTEIHGLALTGPISWSAVTVHGSSEVLFNRIWLHDTGARRGFDIVEDSAGPTGVRLQDSLIEGATNTAVMVWGAEVTMARCVVRDTQPSPVHGGARGLNVTINTDTGTPSTAVVDRSVFARNRGLNVAVFASSLDLQDSLIVDTLPNEGTGEDGHGLRAQSALGIPATLAARRTVIDQSYSAGVGVVGSDVTLDAVVVRDVASEPATGLFGFGVHASDGNESAYRPSVTVSWTLIDQATYVGLAAFTAAVTLQGVRIRDTRPPEDHPQWGIGIYCGWGQHVERSTLDGTGLVLEGNRGVALQAWSADVTLANTAILGTRPGTSTSPLGHGIAMGVDPMLGPASLDLSASLVDDNTSVAIALWGSEATIRQSVISRTAPSTVGGLYGDAIAAARYAGLRSSLTLQASVVEQHHLAGVVLEGADAVLTDSVIRAIEPRQMDGLLGDAVTVVASGAPSDVTITHCRFEDIARAGISNFGSEVRMGSSLLSCNPIPLHGEPYLSFVASFTDQGNNVCSCGAETTTCKVLSSILAPPGSMGEPSNVTPPTDTDPK